MCSTEHNLFSFDSTHRCEHKPREIVASSHVPANRSQICNIYLYYYAQHLRESLLCLPRANALLMIFNDVALVHGKHLRQALSMLPCMSLELFFFFLFPETARVVMRIVFIRCTLCERKVPAGRGGAMGESLTHMCK